MRWPSCRSTSVRGGSAATGWAAHPVRPALSRHRAGDGTGSPQVGLSRSPGSAWLAPALLYVSQARAARSPSLRWLGHRPPPSRPRTTGTKKGANSRTPAVFNHPRVLPQGNVALGQRLRAAWSPSRSGNPRRQPRSHRTGDVIDQTSASSRDRRKSGRCCRHPSEITRSRNRSTCSASKTLPLGRG